MYCSQCGTKNLEGSRFCEECGHPLEEPADDALQAEAGDAAQAAVESEAVEPANGTAPAVPASPDAPTAAMPAASGSPAAAPYQPVGETMRIPTPVAAAPAVSPAPTAHAAASVALPKWVPYVAVACACVAVFLVVFLIVSGGNRQKNEEVTAYLAVSNGYVAVFTSDRPDTPYKMTDIAVGDLDSATAGQLGTSVTYETVDEASKKVDEIHAAVDKKKADEAEAKRAAEADAARQKAAEEEAARQKAQQQQQQRQQPQTSGQYVIADSSSRYLSQSELSRYSSDELSIAMNEIWARHGRRFKNNWLQSYFNSKSWYSGTIAPDDFNSVYKSTAIEDHNAQLINQVLLDRGYDVNKVHPN